MSAVSPQPVDLGLAGLRMTADEYLAHGETPERYELIDGVVVMSPSPSMGHQLILVELIRQLGEYARQAGGYLIPDIDIRFSPRLVYRPDLAYYAAGRFAGVPRRLTIPPDLIVEILSPSNRPLDLVTKRGDYERFGVGEYWIIDPDALPHAGGVRAWRREAGAFVETPVQGDALASGALPGFSLDLAPLRRLLPPAQDP